MILHNSRSYLIAYKKNGVPVTPGKEGNRESLQEKVAKKIKQDVWAIHRIDQPISGLVIFAKNKATTTYFSELIQENKMERGYLAVTDKKEIETESPVTHYLQKKGNKSVAVVEETEDYKEAVLEYNIQEEGKTLMLLAIKLLTGRFHQIRAQLAAMDIPVRGDNKYGYTRKNKDRSINLHAHTLTFECIDLGEEITITCPVADDAPWNYFESLKEKNGEEA